MIRDQDSMKLLLDTITRFVRERLEPNELIVAESDAIPADIVSEMKSLGLFGLTVPQEYGGLGVTMEEEVLLMIEMGKTSPAFRSLFGTTVGIGSQGILMDGTPEQKSQWLPRLATGELIASFALTEPGAGSDAASLSTKAIRDGDHYVVNGIKRFITNAPEAGLFTLMARTDPTWPTTWFVPRLTGKGPFRDVYSVMNTWGANHGAFSYGHIGADLIALASLLRIPVFMHNVPEEQTFRPAVWNSFGTTDLEGADFRACANFGPLYG